MNKTLPFFLSLLMLVSCNNDNPFFADWDTPYGIPPFEQIKEKHYVDAVKAGIHQQAAEIDAIIANDAEPDFANTIAAYERSGAILDKVYGVLFNLCESDATPSMQKVVEKVIPMVTEHSDNVFMNPYFFKKVKTVYDNMEKDGLIREQQMVVRKLYEQFIKNGISLDEAGQARMREINKELASLQQTFGNNLLSQTNSFKMEISDSAKVAGLPEAVLESAAADAAAADSKAEWLFTLHNPSYIPFMTYCADRGSREEMFRAYSSRGNNNDDKDNKDVVLRTMELRIEKAGMLGYDIPADFILSDKMAGNAETVDAFLGSLFPAANAKAVIERADMQEIMNEDIKAGILPDDSTSVIQPWDWAYYAEKVRQRRYALDESEIKPYFKMENVREGVFSVAHDLYGLGFEKLDDIPVYHPDVEGFKVTDSDGSLIGILLTDYFPRSVKRGGAWMNNVRNQEITVKGENIRPIIVNVGNFSKPSADKPSLLTLDEVSTMFHEFGHALHGLLSQCTYKDVSGTNVARDFVELPSQINENWAFCPEVLARYAKHYQTGEIIPDSLVVKINDAGKFNQGFMATELVAASILDMRWHELTSVYVNASSPYASEKPAPEGAEEAFIVVNGVRHPLSGPDCFGGKSSSGHSSEMRYIDPVKFEAMVMKETGLIETIIPRYRTTYFNHIFNNGYNAGYYSYLWAEVLDKDAFELFKQKGIFHKPTAMSFRKNILEKGGSEDPMVLYKRFRGQEPDPQAMIRARGL